MLNRVLTRTVEQHPNKPAIICGSSKMTYQELQTNVLGLSKGLQSLGVKQSDCVALVMSNCPEFVISFLAVARLHAVSLLPNPNFKVDELSHFFDDSQVSLIITDVFRAETCRQVVEKLGRPIKLVVVGENAAADVSFQSLIDDSADFVPPSDVYEGDVLYQYTSGSTGRPKRISRTQKNVCCEAENSTTTLSISAADNILCIVPLFHAYGFGECLLAAVYSGATLVILETPVKDGALVDMPFVFRRNEVLELIQRERISVLPSVPYIYGILAASPADEKIDLSSLRLCISAGNFLAKDIFDKFLQRFGLPIRQLYGCTEAGAVSINMQSENDIKADSIGLPMHNVEIKAMDDQGSEVPPGVIGELAIKSETVTKGYHNAPEANRKAFQKNHFFTGDLGRKDEQGYLYITGRKKIIIDTGGYKVDPLEIEDVLGTHPKVNEVVVVGAKRPFVGEVIKAVVVAKEGCQEQELVEYCQNKLADFKTPKLIEFRDEIPRSPLGKILRKDLV